MNNKLLVVVLTGFILIASVFFIVSNDVVESSVEPHFSQRVYDLPYEDFYGRGDSMYPLLKDGDVVFLQKIPYVELEMGMIVIYRIDQFTKVCHVILRLEDDGWVTKGINNDFEDGVLVNPSNYIGILTK